MDPSGKVAIISGGASGIGLETAKLLASESAKVVLADLQEEAGRDAAGAIESSGGEAAFVRADVTKRDDLRSMLDFAVERFGRADIFHNNAGIGEGAGIMAGESDEWARCVEVDLTAVIRATQLEIALLRMQGGGGVIVNTASMGGMVPMPASPVYAASKAGVIQFSRSLAHLAGEGIRVNAICPTFTLTPMVAPAGEAAIEAMKREVGGILQPEDVAKGVLELVLDDSRAGAVMRVTVRKGLDYTFERR
jgi:NAD(P)-dependent dehydrogenase (short-subunit alcohol dehydrogenase family)